MIRPGIVLLLMIFTVCSFCGKDFVCLWRHSWRCKEKYKVDNNYHDNVNETQNRLLVVNQNHHEGNSLLIKCSCGKKCKGQRGLKAHQRSCRVIKELHGNLFEHLDEDVNDTPDDIDDPIERLHPEIKPGIKLPRTKSQWEEANTYFKIKLAINDIAEANIDDLALCMSSVIYNYFKDTYGTTNALNSNVGVFDKYNDLTNGQLKSKL